MKRILSDIYLSTPFAVRSFKNIQPLRIIFLKKKFKIWLRFQKWKKQWGIPFPFSHICIWIGCVKLSLIRKEYLSSLVNVLINSPKIFCITKRDFSQLNLTHSDQLVWWRSHHTDINGVWNQLPCYLLKVLVKSAILDIYLNTFFAVRNFGNIWALVVIFFLKMSKI